MSIIPKEEVTEYLTPQQCSGIDVSYIDTQRRPKFSNRELEALVSGVREHRVVLIPPNGAPPYRSTNATRQNCWKDILAKVNAEADPDSIRTLPEVVKRWRYLKSRTRVKARRLTKWDKSLSDIQKRVMEIVGDREIAPGEDNDEDGWDEGYEIDVGDVTVGEPDDDESVERQDIPGTDQPNSSVQYVTTDAVAVKSQPMTQSYASGHVINNASHYAMPTCSVSNSPFQENTVPRRIRDGLNSHPVPQNADHNTAGRYERAHPPNEAHSTNQNFRDSRFQGERLQVDKSNVNITVQSCSCNHGNQSKTTDELRLELEKERLGIEKQRLEIERERLAIERERLHMEKKRINIPEQKLT